MSLAVLPKATRRDLLRLRYRALLLTAYDTGCPRFELTAMPVTDIEELMPTVQG